MRQIVNREIIWRGIKAPSLELCTVRRDRDGCLFSGMLIGRLRGKPFGVCYEILVDKTFATRRLIVERRDTRNITTVRIQRKDDVWLVKGVPRDDLSECLDVDLEASPATNTLPIRRTGLKVGESVDVTAAWVRLSSLNVQPLKQSYKRLGLRKYLYRSASGFTATVEVDRFGFVTRYDNIWKEV